MMMIIEMMIIEITIKLALILWKRIRNKVIYYKEKYIYYMEKNPK